MRFAAAVISLAALVPCEAGCQAVKDPDAAEANAPLVGKDVLVRISVGSWIDGSLEGTLKEETADGWTLVHPELGELRLPRGWVQSIAAVEPQKVIDEPTKPQQSPPVPPAEAPGDRLPAATLAALAVAALAAVAAALSAFRLRQAPPIRQPATPYEPLAAQVLALERRLAESERSTAAALQDVGAASREAKDACGRMIQACLALPPRLDECDREIQRLRAGSDASTFGKHVRRFARIDLGVRERLRSGRSGPDSLQAISALLEDALAECGVERFEPEEGSDYRRAIGVDDDPEIIPTEDPTRAFLIAAVLRPGYRFAQGDGDRIVLPAQVAVFGCQPSPARSAEGAL